MSTKGQESQLQVTEPSKQQNQLHSAKAVLHFPGYDSTCVRAGMLSHSPASLKAVFSGAMQFGNGLHAETEMMSGFFPSDSS